MPLKTCEVMGLEPWDVGPYTSPAYATGCYSLILSSLITKPSIPRRGETEAEAETWKSRQGNLIRGEAEIEARPAKAPIIQGNDHYC